MLFDQITGAPPMKGLQFSDGGVEEARSRRGPWVKATVSISLSVAKCEASEKWWPTWHRERGGRKKYPGQPFARGNILIHHPPPPLASFLPADTCKLISSLHCLVWLIMLHIQQLLPLHIAKQMDKDKDVIKPLKEQHETKKST